jgi:hypothetical protein
MRIYKPGVYLCVAELQARNLEVTKNSPAAVQACAGATPVPLVSSPTYATIPWPALDLLIARGWRFSWPSPP